MKTFVGLIVVACFAGAVFAQQPNQPPKPGPEQQKLQLWAGEWNYEGESHTTFLGPGEKFTGRMTARSILNGLGLESLSNEQRPSGEKQTVEIDTYDPVTKSYTQQGPLGGTPFPLCRMGSSRAAGTGSWGMRTGHAIRVRAPRPCPTGLLHRVRRTCPTRSGAGACWDHRC